MAPTAPTPAQLPLRSILSGARVDRAKISVENQTDRA
jgi:hypothetical protein